MPPYPLYGETTAIPGASAGGTLHTHSNKFPIEREVILSSADKNTKIPILQEYRRKERNKTMSTISPDAPNKLVAWTTANNSSTGHGVQLPETPLRPHQTYLTAMPVHQATYSGGPHTGAVPRTYDPSRGKYLAGDVQLATPLVHRDGIHASKSMGDVTDQSKPAATVVGIHEMLPRHFPTEIREDKISMEHMGSVAPPTELTDIKLNKDGNDGDKNKAFSTRTYHTLKGMISSRFNKTSKDATDTSLSKSNTSLADLNAVALNNMEKEVNNAVTKDDRGTDVDVRLGDDLPARLGQTVQMESREGACARLAGLGDSRIGTMGNMGVVYAKVLDQSGQCVVNVDGNVNDGRVIGADLIHATNQALHAERNAAKPDTLKTPQPIYSDRSYRNPNISQYAKPNTQQSSYSDQNAGIYMVMRQGGVHYTGSPGQKPYEPDKSASYQHHMGQNGGSNDPQHNIAMNQSGRYSQQHYSLQGGPYQGHLMGQTHISTNEQGQKGGQLGPGVMYQHQSSPSGQFNGAVNGGSGYYSGNANGYGASATSCDRVDDMGKEDGIKSAGDYGGKDEKSGMKKGVNGVVRRSKFGSSGIGSGSGQSSDYDKTNVDSGRGSAISGQQMNREPAETSEESSTTPQGNDSEWVDLVESELRQILDPHAHHQSTPLGPNGGGNNSTISDSISSMTPPLPPLSPGGGNTSRYKLSHNSSGVYGIKQDYGPIDGRKTSQSQGRTNATSRFNWNKSWDRNKATLLGGSVTDVTSTTGTGLDSLLDDDVATSIATGDARAIRHQLEGLENMYSQVLQLLGVKRQGMKSQGYQPSDPRFNKRRFHGSVSSVPSSVSSRPIRDKRRQDERKKVKDIKGINKRFQRLESHVVTLARSVAHLSSEMRTQHLMIQEMENIRSELSALRSHTLASTSRSQSMPRLTSGLSSLPALTNPTRVKKLTKFFGDEPPLLRLFLKKLGYEKYAGVFESERVGMVELPYMSEERLQSMGIPLGPRLRILQEAHVSVLTTDQLCVL